MCLDSFVGVRRFVFHSWANTLTITHQWLFEITLHNSVWLCVCWCAHCECGGAEPGHLCSWCNTRLFGTCRQTVQSALTFRCVHNDRDYCEWVKYYTTTTIRPFNAFFTLYFLTKRRCKNKQTNKQMTQNDMNLQKQNQSSPEDLILCGDFCVLALLTAQWCALGRRRRRRRRRMKRKSVLNVEAH